jgi:hypothetical protein
MMRTQTFQQIRALIVTAPADLREQVRSLSSRQHRGSPDGALGQTISGARP